jgi:site-specific DNA-methyltransferase (adenine-specific)
MAKTTTIDIANVQTDPDNAREHDEANMAAIQKSLDRFGPGRSIVLDGNDTVRAGNGTVEAARAAGFGKVLVVEPEPDTLVAVRRPEWSEQEAAGYAIADNRAAELAKWDVPQLQSVIDSIPDIDLGDIGFAQDQLDALIQSSAGGGKSPDDVTQDEPPDPPAEPITQPGDIWTLGRHRLLCGDSTQAEQVGRLDCTAQAVITDPPYGVGYRGTMNKQRDAIRNDGGPDLEELLRAALRNALDISEPGAPWYVAGLPGPTSISFGIVLRDLGVWRQTIVWVKDTFVLSRSDYHGRHEIIYYGWAPGAAHAPPAAKNLTTVWEIPRPKASKEHPTMKPVALFATMMNDTVPDQGLVYDPFLGSGTTIIAAEQMGRTCYGVEIEPRYCDVIVERWQNLTGGKAKRETS